MGKTGDDHRYVVSHSADHTNGMLGDDNFELVKHRINGNEKTDRGGGFALKHAR